VAKDIALVTGIAMLIISNLGVVISQLAKLATKIKKELGKLKGKKDWILRILEQAK